MKYWQSSKISDLWKNLPISVHKALDKSSVGEIVTLSLILLPLTKQLVDWSYLFTPFVNSFQAIVPFMYFLKTSGGTGMEHLFEIC